MKCREIALLKEEGHSVKKCCKLLKISFSCFHKWKNRSPSLRERRDGELKAKILSIFGSPRETYGSPRMQKSLQREGEKVGKRRVARLMREEGLSARKKEILSSSNNDKQPEL